MSVKIEGKNIHFTRMNSDAVGLLVPRAYLNDSCVGEFMSMENNPYMADFTQAVKRRGARLLVQAGRQSRFVFRFFACAIKMEQLGVDQITFELLKIVCEYQAQKIGSLTIPFDTFASTSREDPDKIAQHIVAGALMYATRTPASNMTLYVASPQKENASLINYYARQR